MHILSMLFVNKLVNVYRSMLLWVTRHCVVGRQ